MVSGVQAPDSYLLNHVSCFWEKGLDSGFFFPRKREWEMMSQTQHLGFKFPVRPRLDAFRSSSGYWGYVHSSKLYWCEVPPKASRTQLLIFLLVSLYKTLPGIFARLPVTFDKSVQWWIQNRKDDSTWWPRSFWALQPATGETGCSWASTSLQLGHPEANPGE